MSLGRSIWINLLFGKNSVNKLIIKYIQKRAHLCRFHGKCFSKSVTFFFSGTMEVLTGVDALLYGKIFIPDEIIKKSAEKMSKYFHAPF